MTTASTVWLVLSLGSSVTGVTFEAAALVDLALFVVRLCVGAISAGVDAVAADDTGGLPVAGSASAEVVFLPAFFLLALLAVPGAVRVEGVSAASSAAEATAEVRRLDLARAGVWEEAWEGSTARVFGT